MGISNINDDVMPTGAMLDTLQGLNRDTGVGIAEFEMGAHESPFVSADHSQRQRRSITEFLDHTTVWRTRKTEDDNAVTAMN